MRVWQAVAHVVIPYLIFGTLWILFSDQLVASLAGDHDTHHQLQTLKGWFFFALTGGLLDVASRFGCPLIGGDLTASTGPLMIRGVLASSIRMESTSSIRAK